MESTVSLQGLNKAMVLAALYNASRPLGMGFLHYDPAPMTAKEAQELLDVGHTYFDYLKGRVMKVDLSGDNLDTFLYDRNNGAGAAAQAIAALETGGVTAPQIQQAHQEGKELAAADARIGMNTPTTSETGGDALFVTLSLQDVAEQLKPAVDRALERC